jgi:hypothetical protein
MVMSIGSPGAWEEQSSDALYLQLSSLIANTIDAGLQIQVWYATAMPRGNPKQTIMLRLNPELMAEARALTGPRGFTAAVEEGLRWWLAREKRKGARELNPLAPPPARKRVIRGTTKTA